MIKFFTFWPLNSKKCIVTIHLSMLLLTFRDYELVKHLKSLFHLPYQSHLTGQISLYIYNSGKPSVALLELTFPLDSEYNIQSARSRKQNKAEYHQLLAEFDHLQIPNYYETIEISVLGHYLPSSIENIKNFIDFVQLSVTTKSSIRHILNNAAHQCLTCSQKIFLGQEL